MKKLVLVLVCLLPLTAFGAAPANNSIYNGGAGSVTSVTVDSQWTGVWTFVDSMDVIETDTCDVLFTVTATAAMDPGQKLYVGLQIAKTALPGSPLGAATDTFTFEWHEQADASVSQVLAFTKIDSLRSQTDDTARLYITAATTGSTHWEEIELSGITVSAAVVDVD